MESLGTNASITTSRIYTFFADDVTRFFNFTFIEINADVINFNITDFAKTMIAACERDLRIIAPIPYAISLLVRELRAYAVHAICVFIEANIYFCSTFINIRTTAGIESITEKSRNTFTIVKTVPIHAGCPR